MTAPSAADVERVFRAEYGRAVAVLVRVLGDIDLAEDAVQEAFAQAVRVWPAEGPPPSPAGWIITTARNRAIDRLRRESARTEKHTQAALLHAAAEPVEEGVVRDDRLRLIFTCCHPALATHARVALTLRLLGGLTTPEIARAFLVPEPTMAWGHLPRRYGDQPGTCVDRRGGDWYGRRRRSVTRGSRTGCPTRPTCRIGCGPCSPCCT